MGAGSLLKAQYSQGELVVYYLEAREICQHVMQSRGIMPPAMVHLGEAMMAALLLQAMAHKEGMSPRVDVQWKVDGPFPTLYADCRGLGKVRGIVQNPEIYVDELRVPLGNGLFSVRKVYPNVDSPMTGIVKSQGTVSGDVERYILVSEQKRCKLHLDIHMKWINANDQNPIEVDRAFGVLFHIVPPSEVKNKGGDVEFWQKWETHIARLGNIADWVPFGELGDDALENLARFVGAPDFEPQIDFQVPVEFFCPCNEERAARTLALLGSDDKSDLLKDEDPSIEVKCEYCGKIYVIEKA